MTKSCFWSFPFWFNTRLEPVYLFLRLQFPLWLGNLTSRTHSRKHTHDYWHRHVLNRHFSPSHPHAFSLAQPPGSLRSHPNGDVVTSATADIRADAFFIHKPRAAKEWGGGAGGGEWQEMSPGVALRRRAALRQRSGSVGVEVFFSASYTFF